MVSTLPLRCGIEMAAAGTPAHGASKTCRYMQACRVQHAAAVLRQHFTAYNDPLNQLQTFKCLRHIVTQDGNDVYAARRQLNRTRAVWERLSNIIVKKESLPAPITGIFYHAVAVAVLLYESENYVLPFSQRCSLEEFNVECAWRLMRIRPKKVQGKRVYPTFAELLKKAKLKPLRRHTV